MEPFVATLALVGLVIVVASLLSGALERSGLPLVAVFLAFGAALGPWGLGVADLPLGSPALGILATLALAMVLFGDAVTVDVAQVRAQRKMALRILGPGTLGPAAITAFAAWALLDVSPAAAAILGAALASTDPVILRGVLRSGALGPRAQTALRLESGMNDVTLLPIVVLAILAAHPAAEVGASTAHGGGLGRTLVGLFLLGPALGALVGWLGITALVRVRDRFTVRRDYESLYALGLAFTGYAAAEAVGGSGFLAAFAAGLVVAVQDVELCDCFLEYGEATAEMLLLFTFVAFGTSSIWSGVEVVSLRTLLFAAIALAVRAVVLYPILPRDLERRDRRLIALLGARGLSSLLFALLPVVAGVPGAGHLFAITCLVVLLSIFLHGTAIAVFLGRHRRAERRERSHPEPAAASPAPSPAPASGEPERITLDELAALRTAGEPVIVADARAPRSYEADPRRAVGSVRLPPDDPLAEAERLRLPRSAPLVVFCA